MTLVTDSQRRSALAGRDGLDALAQTTMRMPCARAQGKDCTRGACYYRSDSSPDAGGGR